MVVLKNRNEKFLIGDKREFLSFKKTNIIGENKDKKHSSIFLVKDNCDDKIPFEFFVSHNLNSYSDIALIKNGFIYILIEDKVYLIDIKKFSIKEIVSINSIKDSCYESIYAFNNGFVIKGESFIQYFDKDMKLKWHKGFRDIIHTPYNDENDFFILEDKICLYDFKEYYYEIDVDGNIIKEIPPHDFMSD